MCCPGNTFTKSLDFSKDRFCCSGPDELLCLAVEILNVGVDFLDQVFHAAERSPANSLLRDTVEPDLYLIERIGPAIARQS